MLAGVTDGTHEYLGHPLGNSSAHADTVTVDTGIPARLDLSRSAMVAEDDSPAQQRGTSVPKGARDG